MQTTQKPEMRKSRNLEWVSILSPYITSVHWMFDVGRSVLIVRFLDVYKCLLACDEFDAHLWKQVS
jgi:hypothetical protein